MFTAKTPRPPSKTKLWITFGFVCWGATIFAYSFGPPKNGFVPDEKTAVKIAEAILYPIYGEDLIKSEEPFVVHLKKDVWVIEGKPLTKVIDGAPRPVDGGEVHMEISKKDARVLKVIHYQ